MRVLIAQELGLGRWHAEALGVLARALEARGADTVFALPDPAAVASALPHGRVLAAPHHMPAASRRRAGATRSYADILADAGWDDAALLGALGASWRYLVALVRPDVIVADSAPTLVAAVTAEPAPVPVVAVGLGFSTPPAHLGFFPPFVQTALDVLLDDEERLLANARAALGVRSVALPGALACEQHVTALALLDPYRALRRVPTLGPLEALPAIPAPSLGSGVASGSVFVYLSAEDARTAPLVQALARLGLPLVGHVRDASPAWLAALGVPGLSRSPLPMASALASAALVVHHGGAGVVHQAAAAGRAQLVVPRYLEQHLNAAVLATRGVGVELRTVPDDPALAAIVKQLSEAGVAVGTLCDEVHAALTPDAAGQLAVRVLLAAG